MKLRDYLQEEYIGRVKEFLGKKTGTFEVFKNPSRNELNSLIKGFEDFRCFLINKQNCIAFSSGALHYLVRAEMKLPKDSISLQIWTKGIGQWTSIRVTDNTKGTKWFHNKNIAKFIRNHAYMKRFKIEDIDYFDDAIYGPWEEL